MRLKVLLICGAIVATASLCLLTAFPQSSPEKDLSADFDDLELPRKKAPPKFRVQVVVDADDLGKQVRSYINRELRSLGDVEIVDSDADWKLSIIAMQGETTSGSKLPRYNFSVAVLRPLLKHNATEVGKARRATRKCKDLECLRTIANLSVIIAFADICSTHFASRGTDLQAMCKRVVTLFDIDILEPERKKR